MISIFWRPRIDRIMLDGNLSSRMSCSRLMSMSSFWRIVNFSLVLSIIDISLLNVDVSTFGTDSFIQVMSRFLLSAVLACAWETKISFKAFFCASVTWAVWVIVFHMLSYSLVLSFCLAWIVFRRITSLLFIEIP